MLGSYDFIDSPILDSPILKVLLYIYLLIAFGSLIGLLHPRLKRPEARSIQQAIFSWWPTSLIGGAAVLAGPIFAVPLFLAVSIWILREYLHMLPGDGRHPRGDALVYAAPFIHYGALVASGDALFYGPLLLWVFGGMPLLYVWSQSGSGMLAALPRLQLGAILATAPLGHVAGLFLLSPAVGPAGGAGLAQFLLMLIMINDAFQYAFGKIFGRVLLAPIISPKKTWEGFLGGLFATTLAAFAAAALITPFGPLGAGLIGVGLAILGLLGDLLISAVKRDAGVKDSGAILPGQGGMLDRCDSLMFSAPLFYVFVLGWL